MTTRRGPKYSIKSDGDGLSSRIDMSKGKRKGKIPSGTKSTQGSVISQRQVPGIPIISEPESELSMNNSNRHKAHSAGPDRHLHDPVQKLLLGVQGKRFEMLPQLHQGVMNSWNILKKFLKEEIVRYSKY
ncbi:hypothetical protein O181_000333 [Austropuccinia psidii MF-1]|uniref:Uncharacterized protein n=1 Tax=Austropuccinia psidii MF-1 TaxID=1389203 RepID=A0A9Q3B8N2_9BASI|nr:hypothetical protein [Austropuccinia psidii MF-1]